MNFLVFYIGGALAIAVTLWLLILFWYLRAKKRHEVGSGLGLSLFLVSLPEARVSSQTNAEEQRKTFLLQMEQFLTGLATLRRGGMGKTLWRNPAFALEIATHNLGNAVFFYLAFPRAYATVLRGQLHGAFPDARIDPVPQDYNIFNAEGASAAAVLRSSASQLLPLKTYRTLGGDPLETITSAFSKLKEQGEGAAIQIMLRLPTSNIKNRIQHIVRQLKEGKTREQAFGGGTIKGELKKLFSKNKPSPSTPKPVVVDDTVLKLLEEKGSKPLFECNIRLVASAQTAEEADRILRELGATFLQFQNPDGNSLKIEEQQGKRFWKTVEQFSFRLFDERSSVLLNTEELASIYHFPLSKKAAPTVHMTKAHEAPPPALPTEGIMIGKSSFRGEENPVRMTRDDRRRHFYMIGQTGTGKSTLIENMLIQDIRAGEGVAVIDPHGDLINNILPLIPKERVDDVIYFDPGDTAYPMGLNMLEYDTRYPEYKSLVINELIEIFNKLFNMSVAGGPMFEQYFRNAAGLVMEDPESGNTMLEIRRVFGDKAFRDYKLSRCKNIIISTFWREIAERATGEQSLANMAAYVVSKFDVFLSNDIMRPIILQQKSAFNFRDVMDQKKILLVNTAKGKLGETNAYLIGLIVVGKILISALSRTNVSEEERRDFYLYIDEFQNVTTKSIATILSEARKYRLTLTLAHQFLGQITDEEVKKSIFGNIGNILAFRVGPEDGEFIEKQFAPVFSAQDLTNIDNANAYIKPLINGLTVKPFNIKTMPREKGDPAWAEQIKQLSRSKYARPRAEVESEIMGRFAPS